MSAGSLQAALVAISPARRASVSTEAIEGSTNGRTEARLYCEGTAVAVWEALERSAAYPISVDILNRRAGGDAAGALRAPFVLGDTDELHSLFTSAGAPAVSIETHTGTARFPSVRTTVEADLRGWLPVMGVVLEDDLVDEILAETEEALGEFVTAEGEMVFDAPAHIVSVQL